MQAPRVEATDRIRLEQLCRYVIRPPLAAGRLQILDAEPVAFDLKSIWSDGTYQIVLSPEELLEKLAALVPPPRRHRLAWAVLLARVFQFELTECDQCGGEVKVVAAVTDPGSSRREGVGLPARVPPIDRPGTTPSAA